MTDTKAARYTSVEFVRFKAFKRFSLTLRHFNILVGPNNAGKSTILAGFRILAAAIRKAASRNPTVIRGPEGPTYGYEVDLRSISIAEENLFFNYDTSQPASIRFKLSNGNELLLYFPEQGSCYLIAHSKGKSQHSPTTFRKQFDCRIGFVPILGPVEHIEPLFEKEAARLALFNYRAARNFRNIWHHFPEKFDEFRSALMRTWPGMDIEPPGIDMSHGKARLHMFCPEERVPREIFWAGFGFQVWCQMLTHIIQGAESALFLIDEPDIYLHSELQRQLIGLLRDMGPDILIATHSTEIVTDAETDEIVLINKDRSGGRRIKRPEQLEEVFSVLGSNLNPVLTQLAKTRRVVFVEGQDFQLISKFAYKLGITKVGSRSDFAVVSIQGFNPERIRNLKNGMETTLGGKVRVAAILDKDYRSDKEREWIEREARSFCDLVVIHHCKEIENFLLVPEAIDRAARRRLSDALQRSGRELHSDIEPFASDVLLNFCQQKRSYVQAQYLALRRSFERSTSSAVNEATFNEDVLNEFDRLWSASERSQIALIPGKDALGIINQHLQTRYHISITAGSIITAMHAHEVAQEIRQLIDALTNFAAMSHVDAVPP